MIQKNKKYYIFRKTPSVISLIKKQEISDEAKIAIEIISAYEDFIEESEAYWAYCANDPELKAIIEWHELSKTPFYSLRLTEDLCRLWKNEAFSYFLGEADIISFELRHELYGYLDQATGIIKDQGGHSMLNFIGLDLSYRLRSALDEYLEDCCNDVYDVFTNAFHLKVYH